MTDIFADIETLENALVAFNEGASDEKYAAIYSLERMLINKKDQANEFESEFELEMDDGA
jgi:hypothetical protein